MNLKSSALWVGVTLVGSAIAWCTDAALDHLKSIWPEVEWWTVVSAGIVAAFVGFCLTVIWLLGAILLARFREFELANEARMAQAAANEEEEARLKHAPWMIPPEHCPQCGCAVPAKLMRHNVLPRCTMLDRNDGVIKQFRQVIYICLDCAHNFSMRTWLNDDGSVHRQSVGSPL